MPIYEYICDACRVQHERIQKFSDPPMEKCPDCGGPVYKKVSLSSFSLKGEGWYSSGYEKKKSSAKKSSDSK